MVDLNEGCIESLHYFIAFCSEWMKSRQTEKNSYNYLFFLDLFMSCMNVLSACVYVFQVPWCLCPQRSEEGIVSSETGVKSWL